MPTVRAIFTELHGQTFKNIDQLIMEVRVTYIDQHPLEFPSKQDAAGYIQTAEENNWIIHNPQDLVIQVI